MPSVFSTGFVRWVNQRFAQFNAHHRALERLDKLHFRFETDELEAVIMDSRNIRTFCDFNVFLFTEAELPVITPAFYNHFTQLMNKYDNSGFGWAYVENGVIIWDDAAGLKPADPESFCVLDHELADNFLGRDEVAVSHEYKENAERLIEQERNRGLRFYNQRRDRRAARDNASAVKVDSKSTLEAFAQRRKALEDAAAAKKQAADAVAKPGAVITPGAGASSGPGTGAAAGKSVDDLATPPDDDASME
ncbi:hypothetical protein C8F04DRAFT_1191045 [Mycena alexandri]|uniref:Uncharacterized protein n=1 Tax=Mycena alexandri TaxID=1745969 RepID=A0AAD6SDE2_9AGAR|nr:hypothetical protein C8F04DRAFT_1191045 [Mycena alexandri]